MSQRRDGHDQFRNLFKSPGTPSNHSRDSSRKNAKQPSRPRASMKSAKSNKSNKRTSVQRKKNSTKSGSLKRNSPHSKDESSNRNRTKTPTTPKTPSTAQAPTTPQMWNGKEVEEQTAANNTVFENDGAAMTATAGTDGPILLAQTKIKERKLQWKKDEKKEHRSPSKTKESKRKTQEPKTKESKTKELRTKTQEPKTNTQEPSASHNETSEKEIKDKKKEEIMIPDANKTLRDRTEFENDESPAPVKEEKNKLQWAPGAGPEATTTTRTSVGTVTTKAKEAAADKAVSIYVAPTLQQFAPSAELVQKTDPGEDEKKQ